MIWINSVRATFDLKVWSFLYVGALKPLVVDDGKGVCASIPVLDVAARPPLGEEVAEEGLHEAEVQMSR